MKTQVEFKSSKFPPYDGEEEQINPGLWGRKLAEYLVEKGYKVTRAGMMDMFPQTAHLETMLLFSM